MRSTALRCALVRSELRFAQGPGGPADAIDFVKKRVEEVAEAGSKGGGEALKMVSQQAEMVHGKLGWMVHPWVKEKSQVLAQEVGNGFFSAAGLPLRVVPTKKLEQMHEELCRYEEKTDGAPTAQKADPVAAEPKVEAEKVQTASSP
jgi:hypothetical protein